MNSFYIKSFTCIYQIFKDKCPYLARLDHQVGKVGKSPVPKNFKKFYASTVLVCANVILLNLLNLFKTIIISVVCLYVAYYIGAAWLRR